MLTKRHYNPIAEDLRDTYLEYVRLTGSYELAKDLTEIVVDRLCRTFMNDNDRFSASRFKDKVYEVIDTPYEEIIIISDQLHNRNRYKILEQELNNNQYYNLLNYNIRHRKWYNASELDNILIMKEDFNEEQKPYERNSRSYLMASVINQIHGYNNLRKIVVFMERDIDKAIEKIRDINEIIGLDMEIIPIEYNEGD